MRSIITDPRRSRSADVLTVVLGLALGGPGGGGTALAQELNAGQGLQSIQQVPTPPTTPSIEPPLPAPEAVFPNLFGTRKYLADHGIAVLLDNTNELLGNLSGGGGPPPSNTTTRGGASLDGQVGFESDIDWQRLAGITGFSTHVTLIARYGGKPASTMIGDDLLNSSQGIYGAGGNVVAHLVQAFGEETLAGGRVDVAAGRIPLLDDFASSPLYCNFSLGTLCGNPVAVFENFAHSSYPDSNWAIRVRVRPLPAYYIQGGIFFSEPGIYSDTYDRSGFRFDGADISGEAFPVEIGWEPRFGRQLLPGHYKIGFIYDNNKHLDDYDDIAGTPFEETGLPIKQRNGSTTAYILLDQMLVRNNPGPTAGLLALAGYVHNDPETSIRSDQFFAGLEDGSFWQYRPYDGINALLSYTRVSGLARQSQRIATDELLPNYETLDGASGIQTHAINFELNYAIHVARGIYFAPDFQYFIHPNAQANLPDAAFFGFKSHVEFF